MGIFKRGYEASREEKKRQDKARENMGKRLWRFFLSQDGDEADLRFLTEEPVNFYEHNVKRGDRFEAYTCTGKDCPFCEDGDRPTYKGAYLVIDHRDFEYTDNNGKKKKGKDQIRLFVQGMKVVSQLDRISSKYGLSNRDVCIVRLGKGTQTTYTIEKGEKESISRKEIKNLLPEQLRDDYDGSDESLMSIIEEQLMMATKDYSPEEDDEEKDDEEEETSSRSKLIDMDDEDDEEEDERPQRHSLNSKKAKGKKLFRSAQNSVKPRRAKHLLKKSEEDEFPFH